MLLKLQYITRLASYISPNILKIHIIIITFIIIISALWRLGKAVHRTQYLLIPILETTYFTFNFALSQNDLPGKK